MRALALAVLVGLALAVIVWSTARIAVYEYRMGCEPIASHDLSDQWLECR